MTKLEIEYVKTLEFNEESKDDYAIKEIMPNVVAVVHLESNNAYFVVRDNRGNWKCTATVDLREIQTVIGIG